MAISYASLAGGGGKIKKVDAITSTSTWTAPDDVDFVDVKLWGGGGGGMAPWTGSVWGIYGGGFGGQFISQTIKVTPGQTYTITIGAGGAAGSQSSTFNQNYGYPGGTTSFGNLAKALGGTSSPHGHWASATGIGNSSNTDTWYFGSVAYNYVTGSSQFSTPISGGSGAGGATPSEMVSYFGYSTTLYQAGAFPHYAEVLNRVASGFPVANSDIQSTGGPGIESRGGGGTSGTCADAPTEANRQWGHTFSNRDGGGRGATGIAHATSGLANHAGGGGGGASRNSTRFNAGSGGSGYALIQYWTGQ